jgi:hypothetical protein
LAVFQAKTRTRVSRNDPHIHNDDIALIERLQRSFECVSELARARDWANSNGTFRARHLGKINFRIDHLLADPAVSTGRSRIFLDQANDTDQRFASSGPMATLT